MYFKLFYLDITFNLYYHKLIIKRSNMDKWIKSIEKEVDSGKNLILIAGASSSGKSFNSEHLEKYLSNKHRVLLISADNFYKGVAKIAVEKACAKEPFIKYKKHIDILANELKRISLQSPLQDKLQGKQQNEYRIAISPYVENEDQEIFIKELVYQFEVMNFDEPFAINFDLLANDINSILNKEIVDLPQYSFHSSEIDNYTKVNGADYDILIVEGLYALREELLSKIKNPSYVTAAIDCDPKTLLSRRLHRDILEKRSKLTEETILLSFLDVIMPAYDKYILPTLKNAKYILNTTLTEKEVANKNIDKQIKFQTDSNIYTILKSFGAVKKDVCKQTDYFIEDENNIDHYHSTISIRDINGVASQLTFKFNENIFSRQTESYDLESFSLANRRTDKLLLSFSHAGFKITDAVEKIRSTYELDGKIIKIDEVFNLGTFVELENSNMKLYKKYKDVLNLQKPINKSYRELSKHQKVNQFDNENC